MLGHKLTSEGTVNAVARQNKILWIIGAIGVASLLILNIVLLIRLLPEKYEPALGDFPPPVALNRVPGHSGPAAKLGDIVVLQHTRCVNRNTRLTKTIAWTPERGGRSIPGLEPIIQNAMRGCSTITIALPMPENIVPGKWFIQGLVKDETSGEGRLWSSEVFVVVP